VKIIEKLNKVFEEGYQRILFKQGGSMTVDAFTAGALLALYKHVNDTNKAKMVELMESKAGFIHMAKVAFKNVSIKS